MQEITTLTTSPNQLHTLVLDNNDTADFRLYYAARMQEWFYDLSYQNFIINGAKVVLTPNSLRQFKNILPFGIAFYSDDDIEPFQITDFGYGRVKMGILNAEEVKQIEEEVFNL